MTAPVQEPVTRCVLYGRVSTREQVEEGHGIEAQLEKCVAFAKARGWEVVDVRTDPGISGGEAVARRPGLAQALETASQPNTALVAYSLSRLSRSLTLTSQLLLDDKQKSPLRFASVTEPFDSTTSTGRMMLAILAAFAQYEREICGERTKAGLDAVRAKGYKLGRKFYEEDNEVQAAEIYRMYEREGYSYQSLADQLNKQDVPTSMGRKWHPTQVRRIIKRQIAKEEEAYNEDKLDQDDPGPPKTVWEEDL